MTPRILNAGDSCIFVEFGNSIDMEINARVQALRAEIERRPFRGFIETIPTYRSLAVCFNPLIAPDGLDKLLLSMAELTQNKERAHGTGEGKANIMVIPTCYEGEFAPELEKVAANAGISEDEVIRRHCANDCYCYMLGFTPGFAYLGGMDPSLETPRLKEPREKIPAGSVGIAGKQTGIYPIESPGGWNLIGKTPLRMFDPLRNPAIFLEAGMWMRFVRIDRAEFDRAAVAAAKPGWKPDIREETVRKEVA
jgi:KipI family sensor histidine kinase inhibitor